MRCLFVSDAHLSAARPHAVEAFLALLEGPAREAGAFYLLGDIFDEWLGDDDRRAPHPGIEDALGELAGRGVPITFVAGNHDFLVGERFAARTGVRLVREQQTVALGTEEVLLMHGDSLCTDDHEYQAYRRWARDPQNQDEFLALPLAARAARAAQLRERSRASSALKPADITDVAEASVAAAFRDHDVRWLIHGHTHRPAHHRLELDGAERHRIVLGDWYEHDDVLVWEPGEAPRRSRVAGL